MKPTMFTRILTATLLPVLVVFVIVIGTIQSILNINNADNTKKSMSITTVQISEQAASKLDGLSVLQNNISIGMSGQRFDLPEAKESVDRLLQTLLESATDIYCAWFVFEPSVFPDGNRYYKSLIRSPLGFLESFTITDELLDNPNRAPWYYEPLTTGQPFINMMETYDYGRLSDPIRVLTISMPIKREGQIIGCVGVDVRYENLFKIDNIIDTSVPQKVMLLSAGGTILFSLDGDAVGQSIFDYDFPNHDALSSALHGDEIWIDEVDTSFYDERAVVVLYPFRIRNTPETVYLYRVTPRAQIYATSNLFVEVIYITGVLGLVLLAFCVFITTRSVVRHIKRITENFHVVADNGIEVVLNSKNLPVAPTNVLELDILQSALATMMIHLREGHALRMKTIEANLEKERVIASSEAKTNFFAAMSHEIRTPMNAILGISEIMIHEGNLTTLQKKHILDIRTSSDALLAIINDILDISKMETGKMSLHYDHYNFQALIDNVVSLANYLASEAGLMFRTQIEGVVPKCLYGDNMRLRQVLLNLLGNAVKYTRKGIVSLGVLVTSDVISFSVSDTGIGIRDSDIAAIFETFKQVDTRRNRDVKGTGLGLAICKNLMELMGGTIAVASDYGVGSTFTITLPLSLGDESKLSDAAPDRRIYYSEDLRVLVVDDNEINLNVSSGFLRTFHGINCDTAISGRVAIDMVQKTDYDIIFMDHMMPEMDGVDTTHCIRALGEKYKKIPIIALTANAVIGTQEDLLSSGLDDFLSKPIQSDKLQEVLYTWAPVEKRLSIVEIPPQDTSLPASNIQSTLNHPSSPKLGPLAAVQEINLNVGLENIGYDEDMYLQSLRLLVQKLPTSLQLMPDQLAAEKIHDFQIHIHGLKGSLASIGANALSEGAKALELSASANDVEHCRADLPAMLTALSIFSHALSDALAAINASSEPEAPDVVSAPAVRSDYSDDAIATHLAQLRQVLQSYDYEAIITSLQALLALELPHDEQDLVTQIKTRIDNFDYPAASRIIDENLLNYQ